MSGTEQEQNEEEGFMHHARLNEYLQEPWLER